jgi:hypothetical protein
MCDTFLDLIHFIFEPFFPCALRMSAEGGGGKGEGKFCILEWQVLGLKAVCMEFLLWRMFFKA